MYCPFKIYAVRAAEVRLDELVAELLPTEESEWPASGPGIHLTDGSMGWSYQPGDWEDSALWFISGLVGIELGSFVQSMDTVLQRRDFTLHYLREHVSSARDL